MFISATVGERHATSRDNVTVQIEVLTDIVYWGLSSGIWFGSLFSGY